jgi:ubiquitin-conjugating enzyme E2 Q
VKSNKKNKTVSFIENGKTYVLKINPTKTNGKEVIQMNPYNDSIDNTHLYNIISKKEYLVNDIFDLVNDIIEVIGEITNYCIGCYKKMDFQSDTYVTCGQMECNYKYEELKIGNPVTEKIKDDPEITRFIIDSAFDAILSDRKYDIFEPFPTHFLKNKESIKENIASTRGKMSKIVGINYDNYKDFDKITGIVNSMNINKFFEFVDICGDDNEIVKEYGDDIYSLIRFIITSCKIDISPDSELLNDNDTIVNADGSLVKKGIGKNVKIYKINHPIDKEDEFKKMLGGKSPVYLFHGSRWQNWYSIMRNGLKNCSRTKLMTAGAAYGNGIYLSDNFGFSCSYGQSGSKSVLGVFELADDINKYKKGPQVFVVDNEKVLIQRYLLIIPSNQSDNVTQEMNKIFNSKIYTQNEAVTRTVLGKGIKKLIREYKQIVKQGHEKLGFRVTTDPKDAYLWKVFITGYNEEDLIGQDMRKFKIKDIELELKFPSNYPFSPPFIRIITPRFKYLTGHITQAGALCMQVLTEKHWSPACSIESLIVTIKSEILEGEGRIDPVNYNIPYSEKEAKESFIRLARAHSWL